MYYAMSKAALDQYTRSAAIDLIQYGVRVNSVSPGAVVTGFGEAMGMPADMHEKVRSLIVGRHFCRSAYLKYKSLTRHFTKI